MSRVLVIEDDEPIADLLCRGLTLAGHVVESAADGEAGLAWWEAGDFDAVIVDILLPGMSGLEVCATRRRAGDATPVLLLTALDDEVVRSQGADAGASALMVKPFAYAELMGWLASLAPAERSR